MLAVRLFVLSLHDLHADVPGDRGWGDQFCGSTVLLCGRMRQVYVLGHGGSLRLFTCSLLFNSADQASFICEYQARLLA